MGVEYISPGGRVWDLTGLERAGFQLKAGGIGGLAGVTDTEVSPSLGSPGQLVTEHSVLAMSGSLTGILFPVAGKSLAETFRMWRADWSRREYGKLCVTPGGVRWSTGVRLSDDGMPAPDTDLSNEDFMNPFQFSVEADSGVYVGQAQSATGAVTVTNAGEVTVWPKIRWQGGGGNLILPSGHQISLPATSTPRVLFLDPAESHAVENPVTGELDQAMWKALRGSVLPEGVPVKASRTYQVPSGAFLEWAISTLDPWRW